MTFPIRADEEGEGTAALTPAYTITFRAPIKTWMAESERHRSARPVNGGRPTGCPPPSGGTHSMSVILVWGRGVEEEET